MGKPEIPDPKSPASAVPVNPIQANVGATAPMPRMMFGGGSGQSLGSALMGQGGSSMSPKMSDMAMDLLRRQGGY